MSKNTNTPPDSKLILRLLGGGYLIYLAWDIRGAIQDGPLYLAAVILFAVVGIFLFAHTLRVLINHGYFRNTPEKAEALPEDFDESIDDCEDRTDE